jgi:hypothetical protein
LSGVVPNPLERDGTSQKQRRLAALSPEFVRVDERDTGDLLLYLRELARLLRYFDENDSPAGDFAVFIASDPTLVAAEVGAYDADSAFEAFLRAKTHAELNEASFVQAFPSLLARIFEASERWDALLQRTVPGLQVHERIERWIASSLGDALRDALRAAKRAENLGLAVPALQVVLPQASWGSLEVSADGSLFPSNGFGSGDERAAALSVVARSFERFHEATKQIKADAALFVADTLANFPRHAPQVTLLLAVLELLTHARASLNGFTAKHLDFYLTEVLELRPRAPEPDHVHVLFELAKRREPVALPKGTRLVAGKDALGRELHYETEQELVVNHAALDAVHGLKTVFVERVAGTLRGVHAASKANSADGLGAPLEGAEPRWPLLGSVGLGPARLGFAFSSPLFWLAGGKRTVTVAVELDDWAFASDVQADELARNVVVQASGAKGWVDVDVQNATLEPGSRRLSYVLVIDAGAPAIVAPDPKLHEETYGAGDPVLRFLLASSVTVGSHPYRHFERMRVSNVQLEVDVADLTELTLENDFGPINPAKPFLPWGPRPGPGARLIISNAEALGKPLTALNVTLTWKGLPASFATRYENYGTGQTRTIASFSLLPATLKAGAWEAGTSQPVFGGTDGSIASSSNFPFTTALAQPARYPAKAESPRALRFSSAARDGVVSLTLTGSDFGHAYYPTALLAYAKATTGNPVAPEPPYAPEVSEITLHYTATDRLVAGAGQAPERRAHRLFQLGPFGHQEVSLTQGAPPEVLPGKTLVPLFEHASEGEAPVPAQATLYLGVAGLAPAQQLSLLFQLAEGSEDPAVPPAKVAWAYWTTSGWLPFSRSEVVSDATRGLIASGVLRLAVPKRASSSSSSLPQGLHWLRATVTENRGAIPDALSVSTQAVIARFKDQDNAAEHLAAPLPAGTISKLEKREPALKGIAQPYASFGGRMREADVHVRASERLRHKQRAVSIFDYERLVLERFPEVYKVRCINHTERSASVSAEHAPGCVRLIVVPNLRNKNAVDPLRPRLALAKLEAIRAFVAAHASDFAQIEVTNPDYEEILVSCDVRFRSGFDEGLYTQRLNEDIIRFLCPWLYDDALDLSFGGKVHRSSILRFLDERNYVDFVSNLVLDQIVDGSTRPNVESAQASRASAVLVSAAQHQIGQAHSTCEDHPATDPVPIDVVGGSPYDHETPPNQSRYLGNRHTRELHDLPNVSGACQIGEILLQHRVWFEDVRSALAQNYDYCAHCFPAGWSRH